jgi:hypothetical protein
VARELDVSEYSLNLWKKAYLSLGSHRDGLDVFECLVAAALSPSQELTDRPVISGSGVRIADRDRKKLEELLTGFWPGTRDDGGSCERSR